MVETYATGAEVFDRMVLYYYPQRSHSSVSLILLVLVLVLDFPIRLRERGRRRGRFWLRLAALSGFVASLTARLSTDTIVREERSQSCRCHEP